MRRALAGLLVVAGCAAAPARDEDAERLLAALCHAVRLLYDERVATELVADAPDPPDEREHEAAWDRVQRCLTATGFQADVAGLSSDTVQRARDALLEHDVVLLPPATSHPDPGLCLARVTARETGLSRQVLGRTVRWRRVEHAGVLLPDYGTYAALRLGRPVSVPLARCAAPTIYVDMAEVARRAGKGSAAHLDAAALAREAELRQVCALRFAEDLVVADPRARVVHHASVLLACVAEGDAPFARAELERLAADDAAPREVVLGARAAREALAQAGGDARRALARVRGE